MALNTALKMAILESGKSQIDVAKATGMHESTLSRLIRGHDEPTPEQMKAIARTLRRSVHELFPEVAA